MEEVFDLLAKNRLTDSPSIEKAVMDDWPFAKVIDLFSKLGSLITEYAKDRPEPSNFTFLANPDLSGHRAGSCINWNCRLNRVGYLSKFAALWTDKLYIHTYFGSDIGDVKISSKGDEYTIRYELVGDLKCILALKPLLNKGVVELVEPGFHFCENCAQKALKQIGEFETITRDYINELMAKYPKYVSMEARLERRIIERGLCAVNVFAPEELYDHGGAVVSYHAPKWLLKKCKEALKAGKRDKIPLTKKEVSETGIIQQHLKEAANSAIYNRLFAGKSNTTYLTDSDIEVAFLDKLVPEKTMREYNDILRSDFTYKIPIFENLPLEYILKIRSDDYESFLVYRDSLRYVVDEYIQKGKCITKVEAEQIHSDIIKPKLDILNNKMQNIRRTAKRGLLKDVSVLVTSAVIGLCSNVLPLQIGAVIGAGVTMRGMVERIAGLVETPQEIRNDNMYFLWKIFKKTPK